MHQNYDAVLYHACEAILYHASDVFQNHVSYAVLHHVRGLEEIFHEKMITLRDVLTRFSTVFMLN